jgi:energy-coupling factor transport system permease protein
MPETAVFGRYWAADSPIHALDPRTKLLGTLALMGAVFCASTYAALGMAAAFIIAFFIMANIPLKQAAASVAPLAFIVAITALLNVFFVQGGALYIECGFLRISEAGVHSAIFLSLRLVLLLLGASLLTLTTSALDITDAFEHLLNPLRHIGFPAHEFAMIMGIALRFLPQFADESRTIRAAQASRGGTFSGNPLHGGFQFLASVTIPLFASAFRHAETLSAAMDARCYHGGEGRSRIEPLHFTRLDGYAVLALAIMFASVVATVLAIG